MESSGTVRHGKDVGVEKFGLGVAWQRFARYGEAWQRVVWMGGPWRALVRHVVVRRRKERK